MSIRRLGNFLSLTTSPVTLSSGGTLIGFVSVGSTAIVTRNGTVLAGTAYSTNATTGAVNLVGSTLAPGDVYVVTAQRTGSPVSSTVPAALPAAPTITITPGSTQVSIAWVDGATNGASITSHKLYRGTVSGTRTLLGTVTTGSPYVDTGLTNGTAYFYSLSAVNSVGEGPQSAEVSATPTSFVPAEAYGYNAATQFPSTKGAGAHVRWMMVGDSITAGYQDNGPPNARPTTSTSAFLAAHLAGGNLNSFVSFGNQGATIDTRISFRGGAQQGGAQTLGGQLFEMTAVGDSIDFVTTGTVDSVEVVSYGGGVFGVCVNDGALVTSGTVVANSGGMTRTLFAVPRTTNGTVSVKYASGGKNYIDGANCWDSQNPSFDVINAGYGTGQSSLVSGGTGGYGTLDGILAWAPNCVGIQFGTNDGNVSQVSKATFKSNMDNAAAIITGAGIDLFFMVPPPIIASSPMESVPLWSQYRDALHEICDARGVGIMYDWHQRYGTQASQLAKSPTWMAGDVHPATPMYQDMGTSIAQAASTIVPAFAYQ